ncbi:MAG: acetyltransferase [Devosia sp.]|nr:acetyltransferase [Devosia sp.]
MYAPQFPIETERLRLRPFTRGDVDAVFTYRQRTDVTQYLSDGPMSHQSVTEVVQLRVGQQAFLAEGDKIFLAAELRSPQRVIGEVSLILRDAPSRQAEIGYVFHPDFHGRGYATEAARVLLQMGFEGAGMHRIYARCAAANEASWKVMERLGMRREAHFREHSFVKGAWDEEFVYALLEGEWRDGAGR